MGLLYQPGESSNDILVLKRSRLSVAQVARDCNSSFYIVNRIMKAFAEGGLDNIGALKWGSCKSFKEKLTTAEVQWMVHPDTLRN